MKQHLYLHIGPHKTGSTALQHYLSHNRAALAQAGWLYPQSGCPGGRSYGHADLAKSVLGRRPFDISTLREEVNRSGHSNIIISSEVLSLCRTAGLVSRWLDDADITVVIYCRRQDELLLSRFNQLVKVGKYVGSLADYATKLLKQERLDHYVVCSRWAAEFGDDHILARLYRPDRSVVMDFFEQMGISQKHFEEPPNFHVNMSVDPRLIGTLKMVHQLVMTPADESTRRDMLACARSFQGELDRKHKYSLMTIAQRRDFLANFDQSNANLFERFIPGKCFDDPAATNFNEELVDEDYIHPALYRGMMVRFEKYLPK